MICTVYTCEAFVFYFWAIVENVDNLLHCKWLWKSQVFRDEKEECGIHACHLQKVDVAY